MHNTWVIIGGGFCGTVLAVNLLRRPPAVATDIVLVSSFRLTRNNPALGPVYMGEALIRWGGCVVLVRKRRLLWRGKWR